MQASRECWGGLGSLRPRAGTHASGGTPALWYANASTAACPGGAPPSAPPPSAAPSAAGAPFAALAAFAAPLPSGPLSALSLPSPNSDTPFPLARSIWPEYYRSDSLPSCASSSSIAGYTAGLPLSLPPLTRSSSDGVIVLAPGPDPAPRRPHHWSSFTPLIPSPMPSPRTPMPPRWAHLSAAVALDTAGGPRVRLAWPDIARLTRGVNGLSVRLFWDDDPPSTASLHSVCGSPARAAASPRMQARRPGPPAVSRRVPAPQFSPGSLYGPAQHSPPTSLFAAPTLPCCAPAPISSAPPSQGSSRSGSPLPQHALSPHLPTRQPSPLLPLHRQHSGGGSSPRMSPQLGTISEVRQDGFRGAESEEELKEGSVEKKWINDTQGRGRRASGLGVEGGRASGLGGEGGRPATLDAFGSPSSPWQRAAAIVMDGSVAFCASPQKAPAAALQVHLDCGAKGGAGGGRPGSGGGWGSGSGSGGGDACGGGSGGGAGGGGVSLGGTTEGGAACCGVSGGGDARGRRAPGAPLTVLLPPSLAHAGGAIHPTVAPSPVAAPTSPSPHAAPHPSPRESGGRRLALFGGPAAPQPSAAAEATARAAVARATQAAAAAATRVWPAGPEAQDGLAAPSDADLPAKAPTAGATPRVLFPALAAPAPAPDPAAPAPSASDPTAAALSPAAVVPTPTPATPASSPDQAPATSSSPSPRASPRTLAQMDSSLRRAARLEASGEPTAAAETIATALEAFTAAGVKTEAFTAPGVEAPGACAAGDVAPSPGPLVGEAPPGTLWNTRTAQPPPPKGATVQDTSKRAGDPPPANGVLPADAPSRKRRPDAALAARSTRSKANGLGGGDVRGGVSDDSDGWTSWLHPAGWRCLESVITRLRSSGQQRYPPPGPRPIRSYGRMGTSDALQEAARLFGDSRGGKGPANSGRNGDSPRQTGVRAQTGEEAPDVSHAIAW